MYATDDLRKEHNGIEIALAVLERMANDAEAERGAPDVGDIEQVVDFLRTFADKCHHGKEEDLLFPALERAGVPRDGGPIGVMLSDHAQGREHISAMSDAIAGLRADDPAARPAFASAARGYTELLRAHILKENNVLFPMAESQLTSEEHASLSEGFERIEQERIGPGVHERYHAMLDRLESKYLDS